MLQNLPRKLAWIDLETTGIDPKTSDIIQVAAIAVIDGVVQDLTLETYVRPNNYPMVLQEPAVQAALKVNGITEAQLEQAASQQAAYNLLSDWALRFVDPFDKTDKMLICGYNVGFDMDFLREWWIRNNNKYFGSIFYQYHLDVMQTAINAITLGHLDPSRLANLKLTTLADYYGVQADGQAHDALTDIRTTMALYTALTGWEPKVEEDGLPDLFGNL